MLINGVNLEFSLFNPDHVEKFYLAENELNEKYTTISQTQKMDSVEAYVSILRECCMVITEYFDASFGDGTSNKLFGKETDLNILIDAMQEVRANMERQGAEMSDKLSRFKPQE